MPVVGRAGEHGTAPDEHRPGVAQSEHLKPVATHHTVKRLGEVLRVEAVGDATELSRSSQPACTVSILRDDELAGTHSMQVQSRVSHGQILHDLDRLSHHFSRFVSDKDLILPFSVVFWGWAGCALWPECQAALAWWEIRHTQAMKLRSTAEGLIAFDAPRERWCLVPGWTDLVAFLGADEAARDAAAVAVAADDAVVVDPAAAGIPFQPRSIRAFMLWEPHVTASSRMLVKHFFPRAMWHAVSLFEKSGRTFPKLKPNKRFWEAPTFYFANHTMVIGDGDVMWWPSHTEVLDFELELALVLKSPLIDATPEEAERAIGGWLVMNDWSARDVQADDARRNIFGPVIKAKTFANSIGCDVVTPDELGDWTAASGRVRVDGELWCEGKTADPAHSIGEMLAFASQGELLDAGDVISTGTMPGCCGLELERWVQPGQTVELEIDGVGSVTNEIVREARPQTRYER